MKKVFKWILRILGILLAIVLIAGIALTIYFWPFISSVDWSIVTFGNVKALYKGFVNNTETLVEQQKQLDDKRAEDIKNYVSVDVRDFTEEELKQIESGEKTKTEIVAGIIAEGVGKEKATEAQVPNVDTPVQENNDAPIANENSQPSVNTTPDVSQTNQTTQTKESADAIVARHVANLYAIQKNFEGRVSSLEVNARNWLHAYKKSTGVTWKEAKVAALKHFTSTASAIENDCYAQVDAEIAVLEQELSAIGADLSIVKTIKDSAYAEMDNKKAQIVSEGTAKMNKE